MAMPLNRSRVLFIVCLGVLIAQLDTSVVNLAARSIGADLGAGVGALQWMLDGYNLAYACLLLTGGTLGDLYGRRRVFLVGILLFAAGSLVCGLAPGVAVLIVGRALTGLGAALALPSSLAIIADVFPAGRERSRAIGVWASCNGIALAVGPTAGGLLLEFAGWRSIFLVVVPVAALAVAMGLRDLPESASPEGRRLDLPGQTLAIAALGLLSLAVIEGPRWGWSAASTLGCGIAGGLALALFLVAQARGRAPMVPLGLFRSPPFSAAMLVAALMTFGIYAMLFLLPIYLQAVRGLGVLWTGLAMLPMALAFVVVSRRSGALASEWGARAVMAAGMACMAGGLLGLALVGRTTPFWTVEFFALVVGAGLGLNGGPVMAVAVASAPAERSGTASGLGNTARMVGATLGVAVLGAVFASHAGQGASEVSGVLTGFRAAMLGSAASALAGCLVSLALIDRRALLARAPAPCPPPPAPDKV
jgi:EmrB/QacA subfamily drug resistance transporter